MRRGFPAEKVQTSGTSPLKDDLGFSNSFLGKVFIFLCTFFVPLPVSINNNLREFGSIKKRKSRFEIQPRRTMPRLQVAEKPQQGYSTGGTRNEAQIGSAKKRKKPAVALGADRASRFHEPAVNDDGRKLRTILDKDQQAMVVMKYAELPAGKKARAAGLLAICETYGVNPKYPAALTFKLRNTEELVCRIGVGGAPKVVTQVRRRNA